MKKWYQSKTIIVNVLTMIAAVGVFLQGDFVAANPEYATMIAAVIAGVNIALRFVTSKEIK